MKKLLIIFVLILISIMVFSMRLGINVTPYNGYYNNNYINGVRVISTTPGLPAYGYLEVGDIITEMVSIPNGQIWNNPNNPNGGLMISLNPYMPLGAQLYTLNNYGISYSYSQITNLQALLGIVNTASYHSNVIMRVFKPNWGTWTYVSLTLDTNNSGTFWIMPMPQQNQGVVYGPGIQGQTNVQGQVQLRIWIRF